MSAFVSTLTEFSTLPTAWSGCLEGHTARACHRTVSLVLQALHREGLLKDAQFTEQNGFLTWSRDRELLSFSGRTRAHGDRLELSDVEFWQDDPNRQERALREFLHSACRLSGASWSSAWQALSEEVAVAAAVQAAAYAASEHREPPASAEEFEAWTPEGHNLHPGAKTRGGFSAADMAKFSPDFSIQTQILWMEVDSELLMGYGELPDFLRTDSGSWAMPVHPWQRKQVLEMVYRGEFSQGRIKDLDRRALEATIGSSLRTVTPLDQSLPILKLSVGALMTSSDRSISNYTVRQGPIYSEYLRRVFEQEPGFSETADFCPEFAGVALRSDPGDDSPRARNLSLVLGERLTAPAGQTPIVSSALPQPRPGYQGTYFAEFFARGPGPEKNNARQMQLVLPFHLELYLRYGVALEAHLQNCVLLWDDSGPKRLWVRDWGGLRADRQRVQEFAPDLSKHLDAGSLTFTDAKVAEAKLIACLYSNHLTEVVVGLARSFDLEEDDLWREVAHRSREILEPWSEGSLARSVLVEDWWVKGLLAKRLGGQGEAYHQRRNPLRLGRRVSV